MVDPKPDQDCFFMITDGGKVSPICISCQRTRFPDTGWFWEGSKKGYGPWKFECASCGTIIYDPPEEESK